MAGMRSVILVGLTDGEEKGGRAAGAGGEDGIILEFEGGKPYAIVLLDKNHWDIELIVIKITSKSPNNTHKGTMIYFISATLNVTLT